MISFTREDDPTSDIVIISGDGQQLHAHRVILQQASSVFRGE